jgi:phytoene dehydrogenase-like protein
MKVNLAVNKLPSFECLPNTSDQEPAHQHQGTIHSEDSLEVFDLAVKQAYDGLAANPPSIEMTIPSSSDNT